VSAGNPYHKGTGEGGGQFTSGGGAGQATGRHLERNRRRRAKKRLLTQIRQQGHARIGQLKARHQSERKQLRGTHPAGYAAHKELATRHKTERTAELAKLKTEARQQAATKLASNPENPRAVEFKRRRDQITKQVEAFRQQDLKEHNQRGAEMVKRHSEERKHLVEQARGERAEIREKFAKEVEGIRTKRNEQWKAELHDAREWAAKYNRSPANLINTRHQELRDLAKEDHADAKNTYREQITEHKELVADERARMEKSHAREAKFHHQSGMMAIQASAKQTRAGAIGNLKKQMNAKRRTTNG
jgi:hypothetical protein